MSDQSFDRFCEQVCSVIRWKAVRAPVARELAAHLEDHAAALMERGVPQEEAARRAVEAMGDPYELGHELDRCHSPLMPRLSVLFTLIGSLTLLLGIAYGAYYGPITHLYPPFPELDLDPEDRLLAEGAAYGGGALGAYTLTLSGEAYLVHYLDPELSIDERYLFAPLTATSPFPWLPTPELHVLPVTWSDDTGSSGVGAIYYGGDAMGKSLLGDGGKLGIPDPTPGARKFTVTVGWPDDPVTFYITLREEVPQP